MTADADVISIDLPWGDATGRTAIASRSRSSGIQIATVIGDAELLEHVRQRADQKRPRPSRRADRGVQALNENKPRREIEDRFLAIGIPVLPSVKSGMREPDLAKRLHNLRPDLRVGEIYPYAVLRALWALRIEQKPFRYDDDATKIDVLRSWWSWPPTYKRAKTVALKLEAMRLVATVISSVPGLDGAPEIPPDDATCADLARRADRYDALLGLVAG